MVPIYLTQNTPLGNGFIYKQARIIHSQIRTMVFTLRGTLNPQEMPRI